MSANIDTMIHVGQVPWHGLSIDMTENPPKDSNEIVAAAQLGWEVDYAKMYTELHNNVFNYKAIYRKDNNEVLGVVDKAFPRIIQNADMFSLVDPQLGGNLAVETAASIDKGRTVFGCFKIADTYKIFDDDIDHYFVVVNEHLRPDGKLTVLNTPVRVVCQNTLSEALSNNLFKVRIDVQSVEYSSVTACNNLIYGIKDISNALQKRAEDLYAKKINKEYVDRLLDVLFPYKVVDDSDERGIRSNERIQETRRVFVQNCLGSENLVNYRGTQWQVLNAALDWDQHYFKSANSAYNINSRMRKLPGLVAMVEPNATTKFLKVANKLAA